MHINEKTIENALDYKNYRALVENLFKSGKSTGPVQNDELLHYSGLNIHRMNRVEKTVHLTEEIKNTLSKISKPQLWLVLSEGWCGDAAQTIPVFSIIEKQYPNIKLKLLLRDENLELMDQFLTNGSRSIPKLLIIDAHSLDLLAHWGPRPQEASILISDLKAANSEPLEIKEKLHLWYAKNKGMALQSELTELLLSIVVKSK